MTETEIKDMTDRLEKMLTAASTTPAGSSWMEKMGSWAKELTAKTGVIFDPRTIILGIVTAVVGYFAIPENAYSLVKTGIQLTLAIVFAVAVSHIIRKILLSSKFDLQEFAAKALENALASALVYVATLGFVGLLICIITFKILP